MKEELISDEIKRFIFAHVDSVSFLEALLLLHADCSRPWTAKALAAEFRGSPVSMGQYLGKLKSLGFAREDARGEPGAHTYAAGDPQRDALLRALAEAYRVQRHSVLELIFSPMKRARDFADSFRLVNEDPKKEGNNA